ncbi:tRNA(Met) cytidine acetyltransferase TmcA [Halocalculus aciditolerans]|nr:tRNA(Met) cytidine acetyltransferase TmcA [Halocalculus aciditolerans]
MFADAVDALLAEARATNERRLLVLRGGHDATLDAAADALDRAGVDRSNASLVGHRDALGCERIDPHHSAELLGTTRDVVVVDCHDETRPNALGRVAGAVDGGGLLVLCTPGFDDWPGHDDRFDEGLAVPPFETADVTGRFRERLADTLRAHRGVALVDVVRGEATAVEDTTRGEATAAEDVDAGVDTQGVVVEDDGLTHPAPRLASGSVEFPAEHAFPAAAYEACLTGDQVDAVHAFEALREADTAVVAEANRGRGKSSAAGIAAACLAAAGDDVLVTAPEYRNAREAFRRARSLLDALDELTGDPGENPRSIETAAGGRIWFERAPDVADADDPDVLLVDEAAALPVRLLEAFLDYSRVAFTTTVHGYEGAGRGFDVRFRDRLAESDHAATDVTLTDPIRYAAGDPVEAWVFHALLLDARPPVDPLVEDTAVASVEHRRVTPADLAADENLLRECFGLLVYAHYRTEPDDLARLLDAPNLTLHALTHDDHVVAVNLLAREGGLDADLRASMYTGSRVKGNMLPDVLTSQLRDEDAAEPVGERVMRIAAHHACRSRGLGSHLLGAVRDTLDCDWYGVGYGATPDLLSFWRENGFSTVHLSTTRNDSSGEYSALMLDPLTEKGEALHDRHAEWFARRVSDVLADALTDLDPDVARAAIAACDADHSLSLTDADWRVVAGAAYGSAMYAVDPRPFRELALHGLVDDAVRLDPDAQRLLVAKLLQLRAWDEVVEDFDYHSRGTAMRALGEALVPLVAAFGTEAARAERERYAE